MKAINYLALATIFLSYPAFAAATSEPHQLDLDYEACMTPTPDYAGMMACVETYSQKWEDELNRVYEKFRQRLDDKTRPTLENAQNAWLAHRKAEVELYPAIKAGQPVDDFIFAEKKMRLIADRAKELKNLSDYVFLAEEEKKAQQGKI
ncbi:MAG: DUF1311 domain-containing protein [Methylomonas sp.]|nr:DUF1311 domain-containing protein [Methylomonas sp.]